MSGAPLLTLCCRSPRIADHVVPGEALSLEDFENKANLTTLLDGEYLIVSAREGLGDSAFCAASHELTGGSAGSAGSSALCADTVGGRLDRHPLPACGSPACALCTPPLDFR